MRILFLILLFFSTVKIYSQAYSIKEITDDHITIDFNFTGQYKTSDIVIEGITYKKISGEGDKLREKGEPWLPVYNINIGIPFDSDPDLKIIKSTQESSSNILILPMPGEDPDIEPIDINNFNKEIYSRNQLFPGSAAQIDESYIMRYARVLPINISPFQYNPVRRELIFNKTVSIRIDYNVNYNGFSFINDYFTNDYIDGVVINPAQAKAFTGKHANNSPVDSTYWYNSEKDWYKIFISKKGVYRITFEHLVNAGVNLGNGVPSNKLQLFNEGIEQPIDVIDNNDSIFNAGDYFQFVGYPPSPSEYSKQNLYNLSNVYWFSYESEDSTLRYRNKSGYPQTWHRTLSKSLTTVHYEKDSLFERFGHAPNGMRDYWQWGKAFKQGSAYLQGFEERFEPFTDIDSPLVTLRVDMHGLTTSIYCSKDHKADVELTGQNVGSLTWDGQNSARFEKQIYISEDSVHIYPQGNYLTVWVKGNECGSESDEIRVNFFEFDYWRANRALGDIFIFKNSEPFSGINRYWLLNWAHDSMKIYIPNQTVMFTDPLIFHDQDQTVVFADTVTGENEYFCVTYDHFSTPDSIVKDTPSNLRSTANGADYIIIAHKAFERIANDLAVLRSSSFPDEAITDPRIKITYIDEIYDEFSYGMVNPVAVKDFLKFAFEKWITPAPIYIVLLGDMSFDYRRISPESRPNFIPSMGYHSIEYGLAAADNMFVAVSGSDQVPDMAIGRLSIEKVSEGEILLDKLRNYPSDPGKEWKETVLLLASGLDEADENKFGFNNASMVLDTRYLSPLGYNARKIFRYPNKPEYMKYKGEGPQIRKAINDGAVLVNYYGHGGGYQWDLTFLNDDIYQLENAGRLPVISSVTCYTAHFDNQDVFGEQFIKVPGKGAIGFWGSSGVTLWGIGDYINQLFFKEVFANKEYVVGKAILKSKRQVSSTGYYASQIALLTYLGDPVMKMALPTQSDFVVKSSDISIKPSQPLANDTITVTSSFRNLGIINPGDSVNVELYAISADTNYLVTTKRIPNFGEADTLNFTWIPDKGGLYELNIKINETDAIPEPDHSDNIASSSFAVFDLSEPNIIKPLNGMSSDHSKMEFIISDIGHFINLNLIYVIEIDSTPYFNSPAKTIYGNLAPENGSLRWISPDLDYSPCFWRSRIVNNGDSSRWSVTRFFNINRSKTGYYAAGKGLFFLPKYNLIYSDPDSALILNTNKLPPHPDNTKYIQDFNIPSEVADSIRPTVMATDGKYFYLGNIWYYSLNASNPEGRSYIYKVGTGNEGTVQGQYYGTIPGFYDKILNQFFWHNDNNLYVCTGNPNYLRRINLGDGNIDSVFVENGFLDWETAKPQQGAYYLYSDGNLVYNLAIYDSTGNPRYTLRTFNPNNNWNMIGSDITLRGTSYGHSFCSFYVYDNYLYTFENYSSGFMRKYNLATGDYEDEWVTFNPFQGFYSWIANKERNEVYATVAYPGKVSKIFSFIANYVDAKGNLTIPEIGPALKWENVGYSITDNSPGGTYQCILSAFNKDNKSWDTLNVNVPENLDLSSLDAGLYPYIKIDFNLMDSSFSVVEPIRLKDFNLKYTSLPEVQISNKYLSFSPDSLLQGFPIKMRMNVSNIGYSTAENVVVNFYLDEEDSVFLSRQVSIEPDSLAVIEYEFDTAPLAPATVHKMKVSASMNKPEFFTFNNISNNSFTVSRDSINPLFKLTIDGKEILNGDIVSAKPEIFISLKDNGPLPLRKEDFTIVYNNVPLKLDTSNIVYNYIPYPNSEATITWNPVLRDGRHTLEVLAKDPSGNFFDTTSAKVVFNVYNDFDLQYVYNYPNPFSENTHFTFELRGDDKSMELFQIKIYTIAGRLIKNIDVNPASLKAGFNYIYWDSSDEDGQEIANGVYFYKIITKNNGITKTATQKLVKMR